MKVNCWSKSFYSIMRMCPWKAYANKVLKLKEPGGEMAEQGKESHKIWQDILDNRYRLADVATKYPLTRSFVSKALEMEEIGTGGLQFFEPHFRIGYEGLIVFHHENGLFHGYLDRVVLLGAKNTGGFFPDMSDGLIYVEDLKTSANTPDDTTERHSYIALVKAAFPECQKFTFARLFCRKGVRHKWDYTFSNDNKNLKIFSHQEQTTDTMRITARSKVAGLPGANPLLNYLYKLDEEIKNTVEAPNPGGHCAKWYGNPCAWLGTKCPLAKDAPMIAEDLDKQLEPPDTKTLLLKLLNQKHPEDLQKWEVSRGFSGVLQLEGFVRKIKNNIKAWSKSNGPVQLGETNYGWAETQTPEIDAEKALTTMVLADMDIKDIAKAVSVNATSLSKAPKEYASIIDQILHDTPKTKTSLRFGPLTETRQTIEG